MRSVVAMRLHLNGRMQRTGVFAIAAVLGIGGSPAWTKHPPESQAILWRDPGPVEKLDLAYPPGGPAGMPVPPFQFIQEDHSGTNPKVKVKDAHGHTWAVKFGPEAHASVFSSHLVAACGYVVEPEYFIGRSRILGAHNLHRAAPYIARDGTFENARFQVRSKWPKFMQDHNWTWTNNPFLGTHEFNGLRILMMLLANWDAKDARDFPDVYGGGKWADSNVAIFEMPGKPHVYEYFVSDWGGTLGKWGPIFPFRNCWNAKDYAAQTPQFVRGVDNGVVRWGFTGTHSPDVARDIRVSDVRWLLRYLGRIGDRQIRRGLERSGATQHEVALYSQAIRQRIQQLETVARLTTEGRADLRSRSPSP